MIPRPTLLLLLGLTCLHPLGLAAPRHLLTWPHHPNTFNRIEARYHWTNSVHANQGTHVEGGGGLIIDAVELTQSTRTRIFDHMQAYEVFNHGVLTSSRILVDRYKITWKVRSGSPTTLEIPPGHEATLTSWTGQFAPGILEYSEFKLIVDGQTITSEQPPRTDETSLTTFVLEAVRGSESREDSCIEERRIHFDDPDPTNNRVEYFFGRYTEDFQAGLVAVVTKSEPMDHDRGRWKHTPVSLLSLPIATGSWTTLVDPMGSFTSPPPLKVTTRRTDDGSRLLDPPDGKGPLVVKSHWSHQTTSQLERLSWGNLSENYATE